LTREAVALVSDSLTGEAVLNIAKLLSGVLSELWALLLRDWDRTLRAPNHPETTRYSYVFAAYQLAAYLDQQEPGNRGCP
jgi:integrase/recombinase XerC